MLFRSHMVCIPHLQSVSFIFLSDPYKTITIFFCILYLDQESLFSKTSKDQLLKIQIEHGPGLFFIISTYIRQNDTHSIFM